MTATGDQAGRRDLARGGLVGLVGSVVSATMGFVLVIVLGQLGDAGAGIVLQAIGVFSIALGISRVGMDSSAIWIIPRVLEDDRSLARSTALFLVACTTAAGVLVASALYGLAWVLHISGIWDEELLHAVWAVAWCLPVASALLTTLAITRGLGGIVPFVAIGNVALPTLRPFLIWLTVVTGLGLVAAAFAWALPALLALMVAVVVMGLQLRRLSDGASFRGLPPARRSEIGRYAAPRMLSASLEQLLLWLDVVIVGALAGAAAAGVYGTAGRFISVALIIDTAIRIVVSPAFSRLIHTGKRTELESLFRTATVWLVLFSAPITIMLVTFAPLALSIVGPEFVAGASTVAVLGVGALVTLLAGNIHSVLLMSGRSGLAAANKAIVVALNIALLLVLVPMWGIIGAATAWAVCMLLDALLAWLEVRYVVGFRLNLMSGLYPLVGVLLTVGIPALVSRQLFGTTWLGLAAGLAVGGGLFALWCRLDRHRLHLNDLGSLAARRP